MFIEGAGATALAASGSSGLNAGTDFSAAPACIVRPQQTEGPFFVDERLNRSDLRIDPTDGSRKLGTPLQLAIRVSRAAPNGCAVLPGVMVDVWHCDALGRYSDEAENGTAGQKFLRGYQITGSDGVARFTTIYPGWYTGRAVHIHFKLRPVSQSAKSYDFTSQLYFNDAVSDTVFAKPPYSAKGPNPRKNMQDRIYRNGGDQLLLSVAPSENGYTGTFDIGLQVA